MPNESKFLKILKLPLKHLDYLVPAVLAILLAYQFFIPALAKKVESKRTVAAVVEQPVVLQKIEVKSNPAVAPPGTYYNFKANYFCYDSEKEKNIPSYVDAFKVSATQVCQLGDVCNKNSKCTSVLPVGADLARDAASINFNSKKYVRQSSVIPDTCIMPACAAPPKGCTYDEAPPLDDSGCPIGCGTISCEQNAGSKENSCPALNCAALPQNCEYDGKAPKDANGCFTGCGAIACDSVNPIDFKCANLSCPLPPENCHYDNSGKLDSLGCKTSCGKIVCDRIDPKKDQCPALPTCSEPPVGCYYLGDRAIDDNGCTVGCGGIACHKSLADGCSPPKCDPPPENCRYDGNAPLDFKGCLSSCGNLICN